VGGGGLRWGSFEEVNHPTNLICIGGINPLLVILPLKKGGGYRRGSLPQSSPFPLGRGRTKVGDRNFLPQLTPS